MNEVMREAFERAGYRPAVDRLRQMTLDALRDGLSFEDAARRVADDFEAVAVLYAPYFADTASELERAKGHHIGTGNGQRKRTTALSSETRPGKGQNCDTDGHPGSTLAGAQQSTRDATGHETHTGDVLSGFTRRLPGHAKQRSPEALAAVSAVVAKSVLDSFAIIDRNGERLPVGEIYVSSYPRLINMTAKRSWRASREHHMLVLLKAESERKAAFIPDDAKTRDIFDAPSVERLLTMATTLSTPKLPDDATPEADA